jgi:hypothetical protein
MANTYYLDHLQQSKEFSFKKLVVKGIDNEPVKRYHRSRMTDVEYCLFHREAMSGDVYLEILDDFICENLKSKTAAPVVRFADGEYAFYAESLQCNGLYQQAESEADIRKAIPDHVKALNLLEHGGKYAPLIFPGNVQPKKKHLFSFLHKKESDDSALMFLEFLKKHNISITHQNYIPFFVVYAYLTSERFSTLVDGKKLCVVASEFNMEAFERWFSRFSSRPEFGFVEIPDQYVATQWTRIKENVLAELPSDTDLCLIGAGIGALLVCVDVANEYKIPAIDAGHVLNMMNGREDKSGGARLYTIREKTHETGDY